MSGTVTEGRMGLGDCRILLVEDDDGDAGLVRWALKRQAEFAYSLEHVHSLDECLDACAARGFDVILLDLNLPGSSHLGTVRTVTQEVPGPAVVVVTGLDDQATALQAVQAGAQDYLVKQNVNPHEICRSIRYAVERKQARELLGQLREEFLSHVSHEFRTPLAAAVAALEMLQAGDCGELSPSAERLLGIASSNLLIVRAMVGDLIDATTVTTGQLTINTRPVDVTAVASPVLDAMAPLAERGGLTLTRRLPAGVSVLADAERITQVLAGLVVNAVTHTAPGGQVGLDVREDVGGVVWVVHDTGTGIPPESLPHLFDRLYQVPKDVAAASRRGLGLGLYLAREIVRAHGSELEVASERGVGSRFSFRLPPG